MTEQCVLTAATKDMYLDLLEHVGAERVDLRQETQQEEQREAKQEHWPNQQDAISKRQRKPMVLTHVL